MKTTPTRPSLRTQLANAEAAACLPTATELDRRIPDALRARLGR